MADEKATAYDRPFHVYAGDKPSQSTFHSGFDSESGAQAAANEANKNATALGIQTRYTVLPKP